MRSRPDTFITALLACAPLPALIIGIAAMRHLGGVAPQAWLINIAGTLLGLVIWAVGHRLPPLTRRATLALLTTISLGAILLPFTTQGVLGVYRWISVAGLGLHVSAIVAPLIILCVSAGASHGSAVPVAIAVTAAAILALQPDAAQTTSLGAACVVLFVYAGTKRSRRLLLSAAPLVAVSIASLIRHDPLSPVTHVEGIFGVIASGGPGWAAIAAVALLLLPVPFFVAWYQHRRSTTLALGVYVAMTVLAPAWGTFPVPVMGYGASPILGYFIALTIGLGGASQLADSSETSST